jgi:hypothetical protein
MIENFSSGPILEIAVTLIGLAWAFFKSTEWYAENIIKTRRAKAIDSVQAGVRSVYETYTREIKAASEDGKLTDEERAKARDLAKEAAIQFGKTNGVDVIKVIGQEFIDLYLEKAHKDLNKNV